MKRPSQRLQPTTCLFIARALRDFADGFVAVLLPVYLLALGASPLEIGVLSTVSLLGTACLTIGVGFLGAIYDHRQLLLGATILMVATGLAFASIRDYSLLLIVAFVGTINPTAGNVSVFVPLENAVLADAVEDASRTQSFARYSLFGAVAAALGSLFAGTPALLARAGVDHLTAVAGMFAFYAVLGLVGGAFYARIPKIPPSGPKGPKSVLGPSRGIVLRLAALFSLDAFAGGFVVQSLLALWLFERFQISVLAAGAFFFWTGLLSAASFPAAVWMTKRVGLVNTMVFTHVPSSIVLILAAVSPWLPVTLALLSFRALLSQMDVPTRSSYLMAVVTKPERAAAASFTSVPRSLAAAGSPVLAGALLASSHSAWPLILAGGLKITYDLLLLLVFRNIKPAEER